jgi:hypothetical protein
VHESECVEVRLERGLAVTQLEEFDSPLPPKKAVSGQRSAFSPEIRKTQTAAQFRARHVSRDSALKLIADS